VFGGLPHVFGIEGKIGFRAHKKPGGLVPLFVGPLGSFGRIYGQLKHLGSQNTVFGGGYLKRPLSKGATVWRENRNVLLDKGGQQVLNKFGGETKHRGGGIKS